MGSSISPPPTSGVQSTKHGRKKKPEKVIDSDTNSSDGGSDLENGDAVVTSAVHEGDVPVLSHAARRKQTKQEKRKQREEESDGTDSMGPKKKRKLSGRVKDTNDRDVTRKNSVWVGNMTFKTTEEDLKAFFKDRGLGEVARVHMPTKAGGNPGFKSENRGFAYVDFDTTEAKQAAIALSEQPLLGRKLLIKDGDDFTGRPSQSTENATVSINGVKKSLSKMSQKILKNQKQPPAPTLFFGNLSFDTTEDSIRELLEAHRKTHKQEDKVESAENSMWIRKVRLGTFEDSGKCKGFAFVDFSSTEHATIALVNPKNHHLNGRDLVVEYASAEAVRRGAPKTPKMKPRVESTVESGEVERKPRMKKLPLNKAKPSDAEEADNTKQADYPNTPEKSRLRGKEDKNQRGLPRGRPRPGAALALAKRESAAIVPSQGQKITF